MKSPFIITALLAALVIGGGALASDVSDAEYKTTITITNNGTATTNQATVFVLDTAVMIASDMLGANANDCAMQTSAGSEIIFMPSINSTYPWCTWVSSIGESSSIYQYLYSKGASGGDIRYFPGSTGMSVDDDLTIEPGNNFTIEFTDTWFNTSAGMVGENVTNKLDAFSIYIDSAGSLTAGLNDGGDSTSDNASPAGVGYSTNITGVFGASTHWEAVDDDPSSPDDDTTYVYTTSAAALYDYYLADSTDLAEIPREANNFTVTVYARYRTTSGGGGTAAFIPALRLNGVNNTGAVQSDTTGSYVNEGAAVTRPGGGTWVRSDFDNGLQIGAGAYSNGVDQCRITCLWAVIAYDEGVTVATAVSSGEHDATVNATGGIYNQLVDYGDLLNFPKAANSEVNCGALHNASANFTVAGRFKLDNNFAAGSAEQYIWSKRINGNDQAWLHLDNVTGKLEWYLELGGVVQFLIESTETSWLANTYYSVIADVNDTHGASLIINGGTPVTNASTSGLPNGGNILIGELVSGWGSGIDGAWTELAHYTNYQTVADKANIAIGTYPGDYVNFYLFDEGTGATITDYGTGGNDGTVGAACTWVSSSRYVDFSLDVDGTDYGKLLHGATVPNNAHEFILGDDVVTPYIGTMTITKNGATAGQWEWEYNDEFTDLSGNGNTGTPSFRTASSDADVSADISGFTSTYSASTPTGNTTGGWSMIETVPTEPDSLWTEGGTGFPLGPEVAATADSAGQPQTVWLYAFAFALAVGAFILTYAATHKIRMGMKGSLILSCLSAELVLIFFVLTETVAGFALIPLGLILISLTLWRKSAAPVD